MKRKYWDSSCGWVVAVVAGLVLAQGAIAALRLTWQDNSSVEESYRVLRQPQNRKDFTLVATLPANSTGWTDGTTRRGWTYCYLVVAVRGANSATWGYSNVACNKDSRRAGAVELRFASVGGQLSLDVDE